MKQHLVVLFGGQSSEHEVSCISVRTVAGAVDREKYDVTLIGITEEGRWLRAESIESIADGTWRESRVSAVLSPDGETVAYVADYEASDDFYGYYSVKGKKPEKELLPLFSMLKYQEKRRMYFL